MIPVILYSLLGTLFYSRSSKLNFLVLATSSNLLRSAMKLIGWASFKASVNSDYSSTFKDSSKGFSSYLHGSYSQDKISESLDILLDRGRDSSSSPYIKQPHTPSVD